jgi:hypothetical protein
VPEIPAAQAQIASNDNGEGESGFGALVANAAARLSIALPQSVGLVDNAGGSRNGNSASQGGSSNASESHVGDKKDKDEKGTIKAFGLRMSILDIGCFAGAGIVMFLFLVFADII